MHVKRMLVDLIEEELTLHRSRRHEETGVFCQLCTGYRCAQEQVAKCGFGVGELRLQIRRVNQVVLASLQGCTPIVEIGCGGRLGVNHQDEKWLRLSEQFAPIRRWFASGLRRVQAVLPAIGACDEQTDSGATLGAPRNSSYPASTGVGRLAK